MANWIVSTLGFGISILGALAIAWPVGSRTEADIAQASMSAYDVNIGLRLLLEKERRFVRWGILLVVVGSSLQLAGTWLA